MEEKKAEERKGLQNAEADGKDEGVKGEIREYVERKRWLFFGLPFTFTKYKINEQVITINAGREYADSV